MQRPILIALIGYIIGIIWGLYFKISIAILYPIIIITILIIQKNIDKIKVSKNTRYNILKKVNRILRITKTVLNSKKLKSTIAIIFIFALISSTLVNYKNKEYDLKYKNIEKATFIATVINEQEQKQYYKKYTVKIEQINNKKVKPHTLILKLKNKQQRIEVGNKIQFKGEYEKPPKQRNTKGFNYQLYLKTKKIYGSVSTNSVQILKIQNQNLFQIISNKIVKYSKTTIQKLITNEEYQNLLLGILIGKDENINNQLKENFNNSSLSHILSISGMHVSYVILGISTIVGSIKVSKRCSKLILIILLFLFCSITGYSASVLRAVLMSVITLVASLIYKKNDIPTTIAITLLLILFNNPFALFSVGLILSYLGVIGIISFYTILQNKFYEKNKELCLSNNLTILQTLYKKIIETALVSISAQICILPVILYNFNNLSLTFLISNILVSFIIEPILICGFLLIISNAIFLPIAQVISIILSILLKILITIASEIGKLPLSNIIITTPHIYYIVLYYILLIIIHYLIKQKKLFTIVKKNKKAILTIFIIMCIIPTIFSRVNNNLKIYFIDVGQGDSTLIITKANKRILIDGGGSLSKEYDVGKSTLIPYLLNRGIKKLDYIIISHFDTDHVRTEC